MTNHRQWLGREGEVRAARFLETRGYRIVARNVRADRVEIDLIARRGGLLIFVEVKSRRASEHGHAAEAVDERKQRRLRRGAHAWLASNPIEARRTHTRRFDVVTCLLDPGPQARVQANAEANIEVRVDALLETERAAEPIVASMRTRNETTAPDAARWSIEHWEAAF
jgi:putative endonuclease